MTDQSDDIPDYLREWKISKAALWRDIEESFNEISWLVRCTRLETEEEAVGRRNSEGNWQATSPRHHLLIPYVAALDRDLLRDRYELAAALLPKIENALKRKKLTVQFLHDWGRLCEAAGAMDLALQASQDDVSSLRRGRSRSEGHDTRFKYWCARYINQALVAGYNRSQADDLLDNFVTYLLATPESQLRDE